MSGGSTGKQPTHQPKTQMNPDPDLFSWNLPLRTRARGGDPKTSHMAAENNVPRSGTQRWKVLRIHYLNPQGLTDEEMVEALVLNGDAPSSSYRTSSYRTRRDELGKMIIHDSGIMRPTNSGSHSVVWQITEIGKELFRDVE